MKKKPETIKEYIQAESPEAQKALKKMYSIVKRAAPKASERLAWNMPTLDQDGIVITFAAFKKHLSVFPGADALLHFKKEIGALQTSKGTIQFPYGDTIPVALVTKIVKYRVKNNIAEAKTKLKLKSTKKSRDIKPGGVTEYIAKCPKETQVQLKELRAAIRKAAPGSIETVSYFEMPGYSYEGYDYNGMFAWFSFKAPFVRLHVRPQALVKYEKLLEKYTKTKAIVSFPADRRIPKTLVKNLVKASLNDMIKVA